MNGWALFEIGINAFEAALMVYFVRRRFHLIRPQVHYALIAGGTIWLFLGLNVFFPIAFVDTFVFLIPLAYTFLTSDDAWYLKLFWNAALATVFMGTTNLVVNLFLQLSDAAWEQLLAQSTLHFAFVVSNNAALLLAIFTITRLGKKRVDVMSWTSIVVFLLMLIIDLAIMEVLYSIRLHVNAEYVSLTMASICVLLSAALSLSLYEIMSVSALKKKKMEAELENAKLVQSHYQEMKDIYSNVASYQHDMRHQLNLIKALLADGQIKKGSELYDQLVIPQTRHYEFITGNIAVDALLTVKKLMMDRHSILLEYQPYPLDVLPINENDFCVVLSNILDNAIEATLRIHDELCEHKIHLKFARSWDVFFITCKNDMLPQSIHKAGARFLSSKREQKLHGYGVENVKKIVDASKGQCKFSTQENIFYVEITLPFEKRASAHYSKASQRDLSI